MSDSIDLRVVELLAARLCHDLIGPVAAIGNGAELLADEEPDFLQDAIALVGESARKANRRLQFYRFAYGFSGGERFAAQPVRP
jgi:histidine phosphotransferase ChpT